MKTMTSGLRTLIRDETGKVLILALMFLLLGALLLTPLLGLMSTGLTAGSVYENRAHSLYAADAGVEDAVNWLLEGRPHEWPWTGGDEGPWERDQGLEVNHHEVRVTIEVLEPKEDNTYKITSESINGGSGTKVIAIVMVQPRDQGCYVTEESLNINNQTDPDLLEELKGNVIVIGNVDLGNNQHLHSTAMLIDGNLHLANHSELHAEVICLTGDVTLAQNTLINADIHFLGADCTLTIANPQSFVSGNIWAEGNLTIKILTGSSAVEIHCPDGIYAAGNVHVHLDERNSKLVGDIYAGGEITFYYGHQHTSYDSCPYYLDETSGLWVSDDDGCPPKEDPPFEIPPCPQLPETTGAIVDTYHVMGYGG